MSPTTANAAGCGEPPFRSIGVPLRNQKLVRFFCPAWLSPPKHRSVETGKAIPQTHLAVRKQRCFIVGYGSGMYEGSDTDGYKVVVAETGEIYSSLHVTPTPDMEVSKSFLTGLRHDPLNEGILIRRIFDVDGLESLHRELGFEDEVVPIDTSALAADPSTTTVDKSAEDVHDTGRLGAAVDPEADHESTVGVSSSTSQSRVCGPTAGKQGATKAVPAAHPGIAPAPSKRKMTVGTGVTGQMRWEMDAHNERTTSNDVLNKGEANDAIRLARTSGATFDWKTPTAAGKKGASRARYEIYCKIKTFADYDKVRLRVHDMKSGDLVNDVMKGFVSFIPNENPAIDEELMVNYSADYEMDEDSILLVDVPADDAFGDWKTRLLKQLEWPRLRSINLDADEDSILHVETPDDGVALDMDDCLQLGAKDHYLEKMKDKFFDAIVEEARVELGLEVCPVWVALGVFHHAEIWVEGRKQPGGLKEAMRLPEWPEWRDAIHKEILGLIEIGVWAELPREQVPAGVKVLPGKMILEIKTEDGKFKKCKARYVSRGDLATRGEHYWETSSHQVRAKSMRMFFATAGTQSQ